MTRISSEPRVFETRISSLLRVFKTLRIGGAGAGRMEQGCRLTHAACFGRILRVLVELIFEPGRGAASVQGGKSGSNQSFQGGLDVSGAQIVAGAFVQM